MKNEIVLFTLDPDDMTKVNTSKVMHGKILSLVIVDFYVYVEYYEHLYYGISKERTMLRLYNVNDFKTRKIHTFSFMPLENGLKVKAYVTDSKTNISDNNLIASVTIPNLSLYSSDAEDVITYTQGYDISGDGSIVYQLNEPLVCDGKNENIISTKNELFDVDKTFTVLIDFTGDKGSYNGNSKVFTCLENAEPWYGLEIKTEGTYTIWYNQSRDVFDSLGNKIPYNSTLNQVYVFTKKKGSKTIRYYTSTSNSVNEIESEVLDIDESKGIMTVKMKQFEINTPLNRNYKVGDKLLALISYDNIFVMLEPQTSSIRNIIKGRIIEMKLEKEVIRVKIDVGGLNLYSDITLSAEKDLNLTIGKEVYIGFKAMSVATLKL